jgi:hypothetical protein
MIDPGWSYSTRYTFSPAVRKGNLLFISGLTATDEGGNNDKILGRFSGRRKISYPCQDDNRCTFFVLRGNDGR